MEKRTLPGAGPATGNNERASSPLVPEQSRNYTNAPPSPPRPRLPRTQQGSSSRQTGKPHERVEESLRNQGAEELAETLRESGIDAAILSAALEAVRIRHHSSQPEPQVSGTNQARPGTPEPLHEPTSSRTRTSSGGSAFGDFSIRSDEYNKQTRSATPDQLPDIEGTRGSFLAAGAQGRIFYGTTGETVIKVANGQTGFRAELDNNRRATGLSHVVRATAQDISTNSLEMEKMRGDLKEFSREVHRRLLSTPPTLTPRDAHMIFRKVIADAATGLEQMHRKKKMVHLDVKPDNILLDHDGTAKVGDLGIAKAVGGQVGGHGTAGYAPPEVWGQGELTANEKVDSYALGQTLFFTYTGQTVTPRASRVPSPHDYTYTPEKIRERFQHCVLNPFKQEGFSAELKKTEDLIVKLLSANPAERPTMKEVLNAPYCQIISKKIGVVHEIWESLRTHKEQLAAEDTTSDDTD